MRILFTITYYAPYVSGLTIHVQRLAEILARKGYSVAVLTSQHEKHLFFREVVDRVTVLRVPILFRLSKGFFMPLYIWHAFFSVRRNHVIVINLPQFEGFVVALLARFLGKKLFCIYHCEVVLTRNFINVVIESLLHVSHILSCLFADTIITYTEDFAKHSRLLPLFRKKLFYIYPPVPSPKVDRKLLLSLRKVVGKKKYVIGIAARIAAEKGIEYILGAIPLLKKNLSDNFVIIIAGPKNPVGEEKYWEKLDTLLKRHTRYIRFLGTIPAQCMGSFYHLLDVLVLPSVNSTEAFGMVQVEAMLCGVPVVASNLPGVRIPIKLTGMGELVKVRDSNELADKISMVVKRKKQYLRSKKFVEKMFSFQESIGRYEELFTSLP